MGVTQENLDKICARYCNGKGVKWDELEEIVKFSVRESILAILNGAIAEGWKPPEEES